MRHILLRTALALLPAGALAHGSGHGHSHDADHVYRLIIADAAEPIVQVIDLGTGPRARFALAAPARPHLGPDGRHVWLVQRAAGQVVLLDSGRIEEDHGDHDALVLAEPALLPGTLTGDTPAHVNTGGDRVAIFFDGTGEAMVLSQTAAAAGSVETVAVLPTGQPHHGVAVPAGERVILSVPTAGQSLPDALALVAADGTVLLEQPCPKMHGEGRVAGLFAFGCEGGVAVFDLGADPPAARFLPYPENLPGGGPVRTLLSPRATAALVGSFGPEGFVVFDPSAEDGDFVHTALPAPRVAWALDDTGETGFALLADGRLIRFSALTGAILAEARGVTGAYSMERGVIRPMMAAAADRLAITDPAAGTVVIVEGATLEVVERLVVGGQPQGVVLLAAEAGHGH